MAMQKRTVPIVFRGLNTRVDPKTAPIETAVLIENMRFEKVGELRKRNGEASRVPGISENTSMRLIKAGKSLVVLQARPQHAGSTYGSLAWFAEGPIGFMLDQHVVFANEIPYGVVASFYTSIKVRRALLVNSVVTTFGYGTGTFINNSILVGGEQAAQASMWRLLGGNSQEIRIDYNDTEMRYMQPVPPHAGGLITVFGFNNSTNKIAYRAIDTTASVSPLGSLTDLATGHTTYRFFDAIWVQGESAYYIAHNNGTPKLAITKYVPGGAVTTVASAIDCRTAVAWMHDNKGAPLLWLATADSTNGILYHSVNKTTLAVSAGATIDATATTGVRNLGGFLITSGGHAHIFWSADGTNAWQDTIKRSVYTGSASNGEWKYSASLYSRPFYWNERYWCIATSALTDQECYFLLGLGHEDGGSTSADIGGRFLYGEGTGRREAVGHLAEVGRDGAGRFVTGVTFSDGERRGVAVVDIKFEDQTMPQPANIDGYALTPGAATRRVSSLHASECGFPLAPQTPILATSGTGLTGTFQFLVVWRTVDRDGKLVWSAPSLPASIALVNQGATVTAENPKLVQKNNQVSEQIELLVYRTEAGGSVFYLETDVSTLVSGVTASTTKTTTTSASNKSDADLIAEGSLLYTTGGILDDFPPEANIALEGYRDRVFGISGETRNRLFYSKKVEAGRSIGFHPNLGMLVPDIGGDLVTLKAMDDKLVVFKQAATLALAGDGPDNRGQPTNAYPQPSVIDQVLGCANARAMALTPLGIMLLTGRGFYLLNRGLQYQYIGGPVHDYITLTFRDAVVREDRAEVHWFTTSGRTLVYNWELDAWTTYTDQTAIGAVAHNSQIYFLNDSDRVIYSDSGFDKYDGSTFGCVIQTAWISLANLAGYQRLMEVLLVGEHMASHSIKLDIGYDFEDTWSETGMVLSSTAAPWLYKARPARQECSAFRLKIYDTANALEGFRFSGLSIVYGVEAGGHRVAKTKILATP